MTQSQWVALLGVIINKCDCLIGKVVLSRTPSLYRDLSKTARLSQIVISCELQEMAVQRWCMDTTNHQGRTALVKKSSRFLKKPRYFDINGVYSVKRKHFRSIICFLV